MKKHLTDDDWSEIRARHAKMTKEETYAWLVEAGLIRPNTRKIEGEEIEQVLTMLRLLEPLATSNNQHSYTEDYIIGDLHYSVHSFPDGSYFVEETTIT
jgi:hypothetical protein